MNIPASHEEEDDRGEVFLDESDIIEEVAVDEEDLPDAADEEGSDEEFVDEADDSVHTFTGHTGEVYTVACSPVDAALVATGGGDDKGFMWKISRGDFAQELSGHKDSVSSLAFSTDGKLLASGSFDGLIQIWDISSGNLKCTLDGPGGGIEWVRWHPNHCPLPFILQSSLFSNHLPLCALPSHTHENPMAASAATVGVVNRAPLSLNGSGSTTSVPSSVFFGSSLKKAVNSRIVNSKASSGSFKVVASDVDEDLEKQTSKDKWRGLAYDTSDDQQDITRGKGMVDSLFQAPMNDGTHYAVMSSYEYLSTGLKQYNLDNNMDGFYIAPAFLDKLVIHISKNFMTLPNIKVPLILGIWGGKGQGKSFQCELVFAKMGISPIMMSAGELESGNAGEPAKLIRQRYREAADIIKKGKMSCLFINDLDAGAGRLGGTTQYTVNNQMVNATLMNIADNPTNVQLPGMYNKEDNPRVPIIVTGNDFSTLYAPLIRDGRMEKFYWAPTREDRIGVCTGIFRTDNVPVEDIVKLVDTFPGQSIDFFGALRARVYDDEVRNWIVGVGVEGVGKKLVNSKEPPPKFEQPKMTLAKLLEYGNMLVQEQENVKRVQLADKYLNEAALGNANEDAITRGAF